MSLGRCPQDHASLCLKSGSGKLGQSQVVPTGNHYNLFALALECEGQELSACIRARPHLLSWVSCGKGLASRQPQGRENLGLDSRLRAVLDVGAEAGPPRPGAGSSGSRSRSLQELELWDQGASLSDTAFEDPWSSYFMDVLSL